MTDFKSEIVVNLTCPLKYHDNGVESETSELILKAPSNKQRRQTSKLKQGFFRALNDMQSQEANHNNVENSPSEISGDEVLTIIMMSNVDMTDYQDTFRELILNNVAFVSDNQKLTTPLYEKLSDVDTDNIMGEYISNFLLSSWMKKLSQK